MSDLFEYADQVKIQSVHSFPVETEVMRRLMPSPPQDIQSFYIDGIRYKEKETRLFCYYGTPEGECPVDGWPGIVLVHGAGLGGTAQHRWVKWWNERGYAALAIDTIFRIPTAADWVDREPTPLPGPLLPWVEDPAWGAGRPKEEWPSDKEDYWLYHAVNNVIRAHSFLRQQPEVNSNKTGIAGISWGGIVTSHVIGLDDRLAFAILIYGCGYLHQSDAVQGIIFKERPEWDPSINLGKANLPVFWISGATDQHFTPEDRFKSKREAEKINPAGSYWFMLPFIEHSGPANYTDDVFPEKEYYVRFAGAVIETKNKKPDLIRITEQKLTDKTAGLRYKTDWPVSDVTLFYTKSSCGWGFRQWEKITEGNMLHVDRDKQTVTASIPDGTTAYFINLTENGRNGAFAVSSDLFTL